MVDQAEIRKKVFSEMVEDRREAARLLQESFQELSDKNIAVQDLHRLVQDSDQSVRRAVAYSLGSIFRHLPDKRQVWKDLHNLVSPDERPAVRQAAAYSLGPAFKYIPDKDLAWKDLHDLVSPSQERAVRQAAILSLGSALKYISDKDLAWKDLHIAVKDHDSGIRWAAARSLGPAFPHLHNRSQAWRDLDKLSHDDDSRIHPQALYSLGRASIFKATEAANDQAFQGLLEKAIGFFELSSKGPTRNPSKFCLPFYRSFYVITFGGTCSISEVNGYLMEAKYAAGRSKDKEILLEALDELTQALQNGQKAKDSSLDERRQYLDAIRRSCERVADLLSQAEDCLPFAVEALRRGLPIIDRNLKTILKEIEEDSVRLQEAAEKTPFSTLSTRISHKLKDLDEVNAETLMDDCVLDIRVMCRYIPEASRASLCQLENWESLDFNTKVPLFKRAIIYCSNQMVNYTIQIHDRDDQINYIKNEVLTKLDNINYHVFRINIKSANATQSLRTLEYELAKIKTIKADLDRLGQGLNDLGIQQKQALRVLQDNAPKLITEVEEIVKTDDFDDSRKKEVSSGWRQEILNRLQALKASPEGATLDLAAALSSIISLILTIHPLN